MMKSTTIALLLTTTNALVAAPATCPTDKCAIPTPLCIGRKIESIVKDKEANASIVGLKVGDIRTDTWECRAAVYAQETLGKQDGFPLAAHDNLVDPTDWTESWVGPDGTKLAK